MIESFGTYDSYESFDITTTNCKVLLTEKQHQKNSPKIPEHWKIK